MAALKGMRRYGMGGAVLALVVTLALIWTGCDTFGEQDRLITLNEEVSFEFQFAAGSVTTGQMNDIFSTSGRSVEDILRERGFALADLRSARVRTTELRVQFPLQERLNFLDQAVVKLRAENLSDTEVASGSSFTNTLTANLNVNEGRNIVNHLQRPTFSGILQIQPNSVRSGENYTLFVTLGLALEVEGF